MTVRICFLKIIWNWAANKLEFTVFSGRDFATLLFSPPSLFLVFLNNMKGGGCRIFLNIEKKGRGFSPSTCVSFALYLKLNILSVII